MLGPASSTAKCILMAFCEVFFPVFFSSESSHFAACARVGKLLRIFALLLLAQCTPAFFPPGLRQVQGKMSGAGLEPTGSLHLGALGQDVSLFRHAASGIRVALCPVPGPLCKADIVIPTECSDNGGLPHCLEHLVFMGSQRFPSRGYLDKLANLCISQVPDTPHSH